MSEDNGGVREIDIEGYRARIDLGYMIPAGGNENLMGLSARMTYAQQSLNAIIELLARYTSAHKRLKAQLWQRYQDDGSTGKKSVADYDRWCSNQTEYQRDLETSVWLERAYETISRVHIPRLRYLENLAAGGQANS